MPSSISPPSPRQPPHIHLTPHEHTSHTLSPLNLQRTLEALHQDGLVVLKNVVSAQHLARIEAVMRPEGRALVQGYLERDAAREVEGEGVVGDEGRVVKGDKRAGEGGFNHGVRSNILQAAPLTEKDLLFEDVFFNPFVLQVANAYLGANPVWNFCSGNNALANTHGLRQPIHKDVAFDHPQCPFYFVANIPLTPFNVQTGATEFWLGSHAHANGTDHKPAPPGTPVISGSDRTCFVKQELLDTRREEVPPVQLVAEVGDIAIRDIRLWHAGMPNIGEIDRIMLAFGYQAPWYPNYDMRMLLPQSQYPFFQQRRLPFPVEVRAEFVADDEEVRIQRHRDNFRLQITELKHK